MIQDAPDVPEPDERLQALLPAETEAPAETQALGGALAAALRAGDVVALYGDLGAGKTHLVKGVCAALGVPPASVNSPTFTLVNEYAGHDLPIYHFDAYRVKDVAEFFELGYEDYFYGPGLSLVEWPEHVEPLLPAHTLRLQLTHLGEHRRRIGWRRPDR